MTRAIAFAWLLSLGIAAQPAAASAMATCQARMADACRCCPEPSSSMPDCRSTCMDSSADAARLLGLPTRVSRTVRLAAAEVSWLEDRQPDGRIGSIPPSRSPGPTSGPSPERYVLACTFRL